MFGRRRHPVLATAVVMGASRSAARRELGRQSANQAQYEQDVEQEAERRKREEEEQEARTQRAVEEALKRAGVAGYAADAGAGPSTQGGLPASVTPQNSPTKPEFKTQGMQTQAWAPEQVAPQGASGGLRTPTPMSLGGDVEGAVQYCPGCGNACQMEDVFCRKCGRKQVGGRTKG